jgi:hypothetical protein
MCAPPRDNLDFQASHQKHQRKRVVFGILAEGSVLVLVITLGLWWIAHVGSDTPASQSEARAALADPIYGTGCPLAPTTLQKGSAQGVVVKKEEACARGDESHPMTSRRPGGGPAQRGHGAER